jgi:hypothetical protein
MTADAFISIINENLEEVMPVIRQGEGQ